MHNPGCACNLPFYKRIMLEATSQLQEYYPNRSIESLEEEAKRLVDNWTVINCHVSELEEKLRNLPFGKKQIAVSRYEDLVTVIINQIDI